ncbi:hypothetical protein N7449_010153 [Penicillium cf. viridicatum]|uniref:Uncharacterized protein n=1 Tax=Penicillium cf. viridicatum TaxID=2972119 RepID=A0A9W9IZX0_9EURO|nr:hypothetical protein N7449_010153 [Penicillium cf. viridicatum]
MMPATPKEKVQASARLKDPTHAKQVKDLLDVSPSESIKTKKRKRGAGSRAKRLRMSSSMETISPVSSINSKTSKKSHKRSPKKESKRDNSATKSAMSHRMQQPASPECTQRELSPKSSSDQKAAKDTASTKPTNPFELPDLPPSEFIVPGVSDYIPEEHNEISAMYTPVSGAVSQYDQRIRSQHGGKCETWLARQMYHELDNISTQIDDIMGRIRMMLEKRGASENFEGLGGYYFEDEESPGAFKGGGPENPLELSDGDDNALFVSSDERACSGGLRGLSGDA